MITTVKKTLMKRLLWETRSDREFAKRLSLYARLKRKRLRVEWNEATCTYLVTQHGQEPIHVARRSRVKEKYLATEDRLKDIYERYLLGDIHFSENDLVVDVGANIGELALALYRRFHIFPVCCEPDPKEIKCLKENLANVPSRIFESPLWKDQRTIQFYLDNDHGNSSIFKHALKNDSCQMQTETLDRIAATVFEEMGFSRIRLLKLEAEGAEPEILEGARQAIGRVDFVVADLGPERGLEKQNTVPQCINFLMGQGFEITRVDTRTSIFLLKSKNATK